MPQRPEPGLQLHVEAGAQHWARTASKSGVVVIEQRGRRPPRRRPTASVLVALNVATCVARGKTAGRLGNAQYSYAGEERLRGEPAASLPSGERALLDARAALSSSAP